MASAYLKSLLGMNEDVLLIARQHWILLVKEMLRAAAMGFAFLTTPLMLLTFFIRGLMGIPDERLPAPLLGFNLAVGPLAFCVLEVLRWRNRQYAVTTRRVIEVWGVVKKKVIDRPLESVIDVEIRQSLLARLFGYGDIYVLIPGELIGAEGGDDDIGGPESVSVARGIGAPIRFKNAILDAKTWRGR